MIEITSSSNDFIKHIKSLSQAKYRKEYNSFIVEGQRIVKEALEYAMVKTIVCSKSYYENNSYINEINKDVYVISDKLFPSVCQTVNPQGILAIVDIPNNTFDNISGNVVVALEDVQDPSNVGTIIRSADAFGACCVVLSSKCADVYSPKVIRGTMGSAFHIPIIKSDDFVSDLLKLKTNGYNLIAGDLYGKDMKTKPSNKNVIIVGNEGNGISEQVRQNCDTLWKINMTGKAESLNASVALSIMLYTLVNL